MFGPCFVMYYLVALPQVAVDWSAVYECGIF